MGFWDKEREILRVPKVSKPENFYSFKDVTKNGRRFVDVREHFEKKDGSTQHTTKGMSIPFDTFQDMMVGFRDAVEDMKDEFEG